MILLVDVGNSNIVIGFYDKKVITSTFRFKSAVTKTSDEYYYMLKTIFGDISIEDVIIGSVVPIITSALIKLFKDHYKIEPMVVGNNLKTGIMIKADDPKTTGADLVCDAVGSMNQTNEALIVDMGTATKFIYVKNKELLGVSIAPGVSISMKALVDNTALLPNIELVVPKSVLGKSTIPCMQSGIIFGAASQVDGMIDRIKEEIGQNNLKVIGTGGLSKLIVPLCKNEIILDENLVLEGLISIYHKNK